MCFALSRSCQTDAAECRLSLSLRGIYSGTRTLGQAHFHQLQSDDRNQRSSNSRQLRRLHPVCCQPLEAPDWAGPFASRPGSRAPRHIYAVRKLCYLVAHFTWSIDNTVLEIAGFIKVLVRFRNRDLQGYDPARSEAADVAQRVERAYAPIRPPDTPTSPHHLAFPTRGKPVRSSVFLSNSAEAPMVFRSADEHTIRALASRSHKRRLSFCREFCARRRRGG